MTDVLLPVPVNVAKIGYRYIDSTGVSRNPYTGGVRTASRGGDKLGLSLEFTEQGGGSATSQLARRRLIATLAGMGGKAGRFWVYDPSYTPAGSFPAPELLSNNDFSNGTTGWSGNTGNEVLTVADRVIRVTKNNTGVDAQIRQSSVSCVQYAPYALRAFFGASSGAGSFRAYLDNAGSAVSQGMARSSVVALASSHSGIAAYNASAGIAGDFFDIHWMSAARCILADGGGNLATYSDQINNAAWTKTAVTVGTNATAAPDGTTTADSLIEDGANSAHGVTQSMTIASTVLDYQVTVAAKASTRGWLFLFLRDGSGQQAEAWFNISTGALGSTAVSSANWSNPRSFITSMGNGFYRCTLVARKATSSTVLVAGLLAASANGLSTYNSTLSATAIYLWRATVTQSSVPSRLIESTTSAVSANNQTGSSLYVKGLPASASGLLLPSDIVEVVTSLGSQLGMITASLDSDSSGLGVMSVSPPIRGNVPDNSPIIVNTPMARCVATGETSSWDTSPGRITSASIDLEECSS